MKGKKNNNAGARIEFYNLTPKQMMHLNRAEVELSRAGISFDTGYDFKEDRRDWEFDWSLKGANLKSR